MCNCSLDGLVNDADLLVEIRRVTSSFECDDAIPDRVDDVLERLHVAVAEANRRDVQSREGSNSVDEVAIFWRDVGHSDRADGEEDLTAKSETWSDDREDPMRHWEALTITLGRDG